MNLLLVFPRHTRITRTKNEERRTKNEEAMQTNMNNETHPDPPALPGSSSSPSKKPRQSWRLERTSFYAPQREPAASAAPLPNRDPSAALTMCPGVARRLALAHEAAPMLRYAGYAHATAPLPAPEPTPTDPPGNHTLRFPFFVSAR